MPDIALPPNNPPSLKALDTLEMEGGKGRGAGRKGRKGRNGRKERKEGKEWKEGKEGCWCPAQGARINCFLRTS